jgi:predicted anti-sigma-YlaC factor YlaD
MDCKTARLLLEFVRPQAGEMDATELAAFEQHLAGCPECDAVVRGERSLDHAFAKAMQAVEVPNGLRNRLLSRLERERGDVYLRWFGHAARAFAAAAVLVIATWVIIAWRQSHLPAVDMDQAWNDLQARHVTPPNSDTLAEHFRRLGFDGPFPRDLNYSLLTYYGIQGRGASDIRKAIQPYESANRFSVAGRLSFEARGLALLQ